MNDYQSILPEFDVFEPGPPVVGPPGGQMLGAVHRRTVKAARFAASPAAAMLSGFGQDSPPQPTPAPAMPPSAQPVVVTVEKPSLGFALGVLALVGYVSYEIGSAMTPSGSRRTNWGLIGIPAGVLAGPIGLGVMAIIANHVKR